MKLRYLAATLLATLALPSVASAAPTSGLLLGVDRAHHRIVVVNRWFLVHDYRYRGSLRGLTAGTAVRFDARHGLARRLHVRAHRQRLQFLGRVLNVGAGMVSLRLSDGRRVTVPAGDLPAGARRGETVIVLVLSRTHSRHGAVNVQGLKPGSTGAGGGAPNVNGTGGATGSTGNNGGGANPPTPISPAIKVVGTIVTVSGTGVTLLTSDGHTLRFVVDDPAITDGFLVGDEVLATYNNMSDGSLDASDLSWNDHTVTGTVTAVSPASVTITPDSTGRPMTFVTDPTFGLLSGVQVGDSVQIDYYKSAAGLSIDNFYD